VTGGMPQVRLGVIRNRRGGDKKKKKVWGERPILLRRRQFAREEVRSSAYVGRKGARLYFPGKGTGKGNAGMGACGGGKRREGSLFIPKNNLIEGAK